MKISRYIIMVGILLIVVILFSIAVLLFLTGFDELGKDFVFIGYMLSFVGFFVSMGMTVKYLK